MIELKIELLANGLISRFQFIHDAQCRAMVVSHSSNPNSNYSYQKKRFQVANQF